MARPLLFAFAFAALMAGCAAPDSSETRIEQPAPVPVPAPGAATAAASGVGDTGERPRAAPVRVVFLGDSLVEGWGLRASEALPAQVEELLGAGGSSSPIKAINAGVSGNTTGDALARVAAVLDGPRAEGAEILFVALGPNDYLQGVPAAVVRRNLNAVIDAGRYRGLQVVVAGFTPPPAFMASRDNAAYQDVFKDIASRPDVVFMPDFLGAIGFDPAYYQRDGVHPTAQGTRKVAQTVAAALSDVIAGAR